MNEPCWTQTIMFAPFLPSPPTAETPQEGGNGELARPEAYSSLSYGYVALKLRHLQL